MVDRGSPNDTTMLSKILPILQRKRIIRKGYIILMDYGYYFYKNYKLALQKYHVIPLILTRSKFNNEKLINMLNYLSHLFHAKSNLNTVKKHTKNQLMNSWKRLIKEIKSNFTEDIYEMGGKNKSNKNIYTSQLYSII